jgi:outer membrane protein assembly factor BamB
MSGGVTNPDHSSSNGSMGGSTSPPSTNGTMTPPSISPGSAPSEMSDYANDWPAPNKDYNNTRESTSSGIDSSNVANLKLAWAYEIKGIGTNGGGTTNPLILGNNVYFQDGKGNVISLDLRNGSVNWEHMYNSSYLEGPNGPSVGYGKIFTQKDEWTTAALNLSTGKELWTVQLSFVNTTGIDIQPAVYDGMVYTSTVPGTGDVFYHPGGIGVIFALNESTGEVLWNFTTTDPNLWGHPEVNSGGGCWYTPAIDTSTGVMYWAVANPAPFAGAKGWPNGASFDDALYTNSMIALNHNNGDLEWYKQVYAHDLFDHDLQIAPIFVKGVTIGNVTQDVVIGAGKMGYVYAFNHESGELLWQTPVGEHMNDYLDRLEGSTSVLPGIIGGVETPMAYSDGMVYVPVVNMATVYEPTGFNFSSINFDNSTGELVAIDVSRGKIVWDKKLKVLNVGAATVVNDVVFTADLNGTIYGFDKKTGAELYTYQAPAGINGWPAVSGDTIVWPAGRFGTPSLIALRLGG